MTSLHTKLYTNCQKPLYQLQAKHHGLDGLELAVWQLPCPATPQLNKALRLASLRGRNMSLVEGQVLRRLTKQGIHIAPVPRQEAQCVELEEDQALILGLLFRTIAPMRNAERMRQISQQIEDMPQAEAAYWLGMAMHRKNPRRVLSALRLLLTTSQTGRI